MMTINELVLMKIKVLSLEIENIQAKAEKEVELRNKKLTEIVELIKEEHGLEGKQFFINQETGEITIKEE